MEGEQGASAIVWRATLGVDARTIVEAVDYDEDTRGDRGVGPDPT